MLRLIGEADFYAEFDGYLVGLLGRSPETSRSYITMGKMAAKKLGKHVLRVTTEDLMALISEAPWAPATKRSMVVAFHQIGDFAKLKGHVKRNDHEHLKTPKVPRNKKPPLHPRDAYRLLGAVETPIQARTTYLGLFAGLRIAESTSIREEHWQGDTLVVMGKGSKKRRVPVHRELEKMREVILSRPAASKTSAGVIFGRLRDRLDLRDVEGNPATPHTLRRTFSTALYAAKTPYERVGVLMGHDIGVTGDSYIDFDEEVLAGDVAGVEYPSGEPIQLSLF